VIKKAKFAPVLALGFILATSGLAPANAATTEFPDLGEVSSVESYAEQSAGNGDLQFYAADNYKGPMRSLDECRKVADFMKARKFKITRECRRHDDGKWWFKMSA
jgi:hypothetical protein